MGVAGLLVRKHSALASAVFSCAALSGFLFTASTGQHASSLVTGQQNGKRSARLCCHVALRVAPALTAPLSTQQEDARHTWSTASAAA